MGGENFWVTTAASSETDQWATPQDFFDTLSSEFDFVLDPCALSTSAKTEAWFGPDHPQNERRDGLSADWHQEVSDLGGGVVFMNPPYGKTIRQWTTKANKTAVSGTTVVCLLPSRTDTRWFHEDCIMHECRFIKGRLKFGQAQFGAPFPSVVVVMRGSTLEQWKLWANTHK